MSKKKKFRRLSSELREEVVRHDGLETLRDKRRAMKELGYDVSRRGDYALSMEDARKAAKRDLAQTMQQMRPLKLDRGTDAMFVDRQSRGPGGFMTNEGMPSPGLTERQAFEQMRQIERRKTAVREAIEWLKAKDFKLGRVNASLFHNFLQEGVIKDDAWELDKPKAREAQLFLVEHDWAKAFANAQGYKGMPWHQPYDLCAFELMIGGKRVLTILEKEIGSIFMRTSVGWLTLAPWDRKESADPWKFLTDIIFDQVKAISVALEARVAETELRAAPTVKRKGSEPFEVRYHVVRLMRREKRYVYEAHEPTYRMPLHFRSGHYKHYHMEEHREGHTWLSAGPDRREPCSVCGAWRTWTEWMLVGDPDLGFIDKEYRL